MHFSNQDNFLSGTNANYIDYMHTQWEADPSSVHPSWNAYFSGTEGGATTAFEAPPSLGKTSTEMQLDQLISMLQRGNIGSPSSAADTSRVAEEATRLSMLLRAFLTHGHLVADIDPLNLKEVYKDSPSLAKKFRFPDESLLRLLDPAAYGFTKEDMEREFHFSNPYAGAIVQ